MASTSEQLAATEHDLRTQLDELRAQVRDLINDKVAPRVADAAQAAEGAARQVRDAAQCQARMVGDEIRAHPFSSVLIAAAVGALVGRVMR